MADQPDTTNPSATFTSLDMAALAGRVARMLMEAAPAPVPTPEENDRKAILEHAKSTFRAADDCLTELTPIQVRADALYLAVTSDTVFADGNREALAILVEDLRNSLREYEEHVELSRDGALKLRRLAGHVGDINPEQGADA